MNKVLVTGANGMLGQDLCPILQEFGYEVIKTDIDTIAVSTLKIIDLFNRYIFAFNLNLIGKQILI